ncbi:MAG: FAD-dependent oxidoreductase [Chitinophagales bacterium]
MESSESNEGNITAGKNITYWLDSVEPISYSPLAENIETDVVIVGGGLGGISVAYNLMQSGKRVVLVEDGNIGSGETGRTTAHLVNALDDRYHHLEKLFGEGDIKLIAESHSAAIDFIEQTIQREGISCDFIRVNGYLFRHPSDEANALEKEYEAARKAGINVELLKATPAIAPDQPCLLFPRQAQFHPMKYMHGLCKVILAKGGKLFTQTHASEISSEGIKTDKGFTVKAKHVVVATNSPVNNKYVMHMKQGGFRTYVIGCLIKKGLIPNALWWDTGDVEMDSKIPPYHYVRLQPYNDTYDLLISGGEDHATGLTDNGVPEEERYTRLMQWTSKRFPVESLVYSWSGQVMEPMDSIAYIGRNPWDKENVYIVTGDSGNGMTHCTIAGILITDLINGKDSKWEKLYSPKRGILKASGTFFKEFFGGLVSYLKQRPEEQDAAVLAEIKNGEGKSINLQGRNVGAHRDENGKLHIVSAACTHLGCTVKWNNDEKSWDCPCHGSRFAYDGRVLNGPAIKDLDSFSEI